MKIMLWAVMWCLVAFGVACMGQDTNSTPPRSNTEQGDPRSLDLSCAFLNGKSVFTYSLNEITDVFGRPTIVTPEHTEKDKEGKDVVYPAKLFYHNRGLLFEFTKSDGHSTNPQVRILWIFLSRFWDKGNTAFFEQYRGGISPAISADMKLAAAKQTMPTMIFKQDDSAALNRAISQTLQAFVKLAKEDRYYSHRDGQEAKELIDDTIPDWSMRTAQVAKTEFGEISFAYDETTTFLEHVKLKGKTPTNPSSTEPPSKQ